MYKYAQRRRVIRIVLHKIMVLVARTSQTDVVIHSLRYTIAAETLYQWGWVITSSPFFREWNDVELK